jgi:hypothetical protein
MTQRFLITSLSFLLLTPLPQASFASSDMEEEDLEEITHSLKKTHLTPQKRKKEKKTTLSVLDRLPVEIGLLILEHLPGDLVVNYVLKKAPSLAKYVTSLTFPAGPLKYKVLNRDLRKFSHLRSLTVVQNGKGKRRMPDLAKGTLFNGLDQLTHLSLEGQGFDDRFLANKPLLRSLRLKNTRCTDKGLKDQNQLLFLDFDGDQFTDEALAGKTDLIHLKVWGIRFTNKALDGKDKLEHLEVKGRLLTDTALKGKTTLKHLKVYGNQFTDAAFADKEQLMHLEVESDKITDKAFEGKTKLKTVKVWRGRVTDKAFDDKKELTSLLVMAQGVSSKVAQGKPTLTYAWINGTVVKP